MHEMYVNLGLCRHLNELIECIAASENSQIRQLFSAPITQNNLMPSFRMITNVPQKQTRQVVKNIKQGKA
jgi:hypothetical protein